MASDAPDLSPGSPEEARQEIDDLVEEISRLSKSDMSASEFHSELLNRVVSGLAAVGGVVWTYGPTASLRAEYQVNLAQTRLTENSGDQALHQQLIEQVALAGKARLAPPKSGAAGADQVSNPTELLLVLCPWKVNGESAGVIEVFQRPGTSPRAQRGYLEFLEFVCELLADFHFRRQLHELQQQAAQWGRFEQFTRLIHRGLNLQTTAYQIVNEGRRLIDCDRVSLLTSRRSKCRLAAISGVDQFDRRANVVGRLERLAEAVVLVDEPLWHAEAAENPLPEIEKRLNAYLDESHARTLAVIPLKAAAAPGSTGRSRAIGVLVVEQFEAGPNEGLRRSVAAVCSHSELALQNALELEGIPLVRLLRVAGWFIGRRRLPKTVLALLAIAAVVVALVTVPADFRIEARGELQPLGRRDVFAPSDGVVGELRARHAKQVRAEEVLVILREPQLELQFKQIWGELQTARKRLAAVEAERLQNLQRGPEDRRYDQLTAEEEELKESINSLQRQYEIVKAQQAELTVRSSMDGQVLTWDVAKLLEARPVQRGDVLMSVANLDGPWVLELRIPDNRIAHVLTARKQLGQNLDVSFILAPNPGVTHHGKMKSVAIRTETMESDRPIVLATVEIDRNEISNLIPGTTTLARIHCGRRSIGYVWLHDLTDAVRAWIAF